MKFIDLINKMYKNQIEINFKFTLRYNEFTLNTYEIRECEYGLMLWDLDNDCRFDSAEYILDYLDYEVEIIEENKDIEDISKARLNVNAHDILYYDLSTRRFVNENRNKISELVQAVNKINKQLNK